jgi:uncharacterized membrane-anchored protein YjiN (DUF445 family)
MVAFRDLKDNNNAEALKVWKEYIKNQNQNAFNAGLLKVLKESKKSGNDNAVNTPSLKSSVTKPEPTPILTKPSKSNDSQAVNSLTSAKSVNLRNMIAGNKDKKSISSKFEPPNVVPIASNGLSSLPKSLVNSSINDVKTNEEVKKIKQVKKCYKDIKCTNPTCKFDHPNGKLMEKVEVITMEKVEEIAIEKNPSSIIETSVNDKKVENIDKKIKKTKKQSNPSNNASIISTQLGNVTSNSVIPLVDEILDRVDIEIDNSNFINNIPISSDDTQSTPNVSNNIQRLGNSLNILNNDNSNTLNNYEDLDLKSAFGKIKEWGLGNTPPSSNNNDDILKENTDSFLSGLSGSGLDYGGLGLGFGTSFNITKEDTDIITSSDDDILSSNPGNSLWNNHLNSPKRSPLPNNIQDNSEANQLGIHRFLGGSPQSSSTDLSSLQLMKQELPQQDSNFKKNNSQSNDEFHYNQQQQQPTNHFMNNNRNNGQIPFNGGNFVQTPPNGPHNGPNFIHNGGMHAPGMFNIPHGVSPPGMVVGPSGMSPNFHQHHQMFPPFNPNMNHSNIFPNGGGSSGVNSNVPPNNNSPNSPHAGPTDHPNVFNGGNQFNQGPPPGMFGSDRPRGGPNGSPPNRPPFNGGWSMLPPNNFHQQHQMFPPAFNPNIPGFNPPCVSPHFQNQHFHNQNHQLNQQQQQQNDENDDNKDKNNMDENKDNNSPLLTSQSVDKIPLNDLNLNDSNASVKMHNPEPKLPSSNQIVRSLPLSSSPSLDNEKRAHALLNMLRSGPGGLTTPPPVVKSSPLPQFSSVIEKKDEDILKNDEDLIKKSSEGAINETNAALAAGLKDITIKKPAPLYRLTRPQEGKLVISMQANRHNEVICSNDGTSIRPGWHMAVTWELPIALVDKIIDGGNGKEELVIGLLRYGNSTNCPGIVTKKIELNSSRSTTRKINDEGIHVYTGKIQFHAPKSAGAFVYRVYNNLTKETTMQTIATSLSFHVDLSDADVTNNLKFVVDSFVDKAYQRSISQLTSTLVGMRNSGRPSHGETAHSLLAKAINHLIDVIKQGITNLDKAKEESKKSVIKTDKEDVDNEIEKEDKDKDSVNEKKKVSKEDEIWTSIRQVLRLHIDSHDCLVALRRNGIAWSMIPDALKQVVLSIESLFCPLLNRYFSTMEIKNSTRHLEFGFIPSSPASSSTVSNNNNRNNNNNNNRNNNDYNQFDSNILLAIERSINDLLPSLLPSNDFHTKRENARMRIEQGIRSSNVVPITTQIIIYGSSRNNFGTDSSDLDMCMVLPNDEYIKLDERIEIIEKIAASLTNIGMTDIVARTTARIPIVTFKDPITGFECDISFNNPLAISNTNLLKTYSEIDSRILPLAFTIKHWAKSRHINNPGEGTLSSYGYILCLIHFLQVSYIYFKQYFKYLYGND